MKKTEKILAAVLAALMMVACQMPNGNNENNDNGGDITIPEVEKPSDENPESPEDENPEDNDGKEDEENSKEGTELDLSVTRQFSMNVGDTISLLNVIEGTSVHYEIRTGNDVISICGNVLQADSVGDAELIARDWNDNSHYWACSVTVKAEGFNGSALEYKLCSNWSREDGSELILNTNKTGTMKNYLNGQLLQNWEFEWSCTEGGGYKFLNISNCYDKQTGESVASRQFTITSLREVTLVLSGNLGFGMPKSTTWTQH